MNLYTSSNQPPPADTRTSSFAVRCQKQFKALVWKCYLQRQRRWPTLLAETAFAFFLFMVAIFVAKPVFLTLLTPNQAPPLREIDILDTFSKKTILGFAPNVEPFSRVMEKVSKVFDVDVIGAPSKNHLHEILYDSYNGSMVRLPVIWVLFRNVSRNVWQMNIRSTERAKYAAVKSVTASSPAVNPHLRSGFLAVQLAVSRAIVELSSNKPDEPPFKVFLKPIPVSPLMKEEAVRNVISVMLLCFTLALLPPVMETQALVVQESLNGFKRALRIYTVSYSVMYLAWLSFALFTVLPILVLASITLILIFRWIHLFFALVLVLAYYFVMIMIALMMALYHRKVWIAASWTAMFTILQTLLAELLVYHRYDQIHNVLNLVLNTALPPMGLVQGLNQFALLETGRTHAGNSLHDKNFLQMVGMWTFMIVIYFAILMLLQHTQNSAIGGPVSWKSIIFKHPVDENRLRYAYSSKPGNVQYVDEFVAKAISFKNVSKKILGEEVIKNVTLDIYRGEFTLLFSERIQNRIIKTFEDLLIGLTKPDEGKITVFGENKFKTKLMTTKFTMGYLHRHTFLIDDLTVEEHMSLFLEIRLWYELTQDLFEYEYIRKIHLLAECDLEACKRVRISHLSVYYRTQLCWALALLLEPRVVLISLFKHEPASVSVIVDKVERYKKDLTILEMTTHSMDLQYADRVFLFDRKVLVFGGSPEYLFSKYGCEYRVRIIFRTSDNQDDKKKALIARAGQYGAKIRERFNQLLILRLPIEEPEKIATFIQELKDNRHKYDVESYNVSVPDTDEVYKRAIFESRLTARYLEDTSFTSITALKDIEALPSWKRQKNCITQLGSVGKKFRSYYSHNPIIILVTFVCAVVTGICIGNLQVKSLTQMDTEPFKTILRGEKLAVETREKDMGTVLSMRVDSDCPSCLSIANAYVLSDTRARKSETKSIKYTCLYGRVRLMEYLVTQAIDAPQDYVFKYAYGCIIKKPTNISELAIAALYSPMHTDRAAAARSMARVFMALMRHYTGDMAASIFVRDKPLAVDLSKIIQVITPPPLMTQLLLILTLAHVTLIPSMEYGLVRHNQATATSFSPLKYWMFLFIYDFCFYMILVTIMSLIAALTVYLTALNKYVNYNELLIIPLILVVYGIACIPQAYIFSLLSPKHSLNAMIYVIVTVVFGETTVLIKYIYGDFQSAIPLLVYVSPQYNMALALLKIQLLFFHNSECTIYISKGLCHSRSLHKCCVKCGVLQECFEKRSYFSSNSYGIRHEIIQILITSAVFSILLLLLEYKIIQRIPKLFIKYKIKPSLQHRPGIVRERILVADKKKSLNRKFSKKDGSQNIDTYLLADMVTKQDNDVYVVHDVCMHMDKGQALALSGLLHHGRRQLCEILAGRTQPTKGDAWVMSKWRLIVSPINYSRQITFSCQDNPLPSWMTVYESMTMIAVLRGIPKNNVKAEVDAYLAAMDLKEVRNYKICNLPKYIQRRIQVVSAFIGAPPILVLEDCTAYQNFPVRQAIYFILHLFMTRGHAILVSSSDVETYLPITNRLAIMLDGSIYDFGCLDEIISRYSQKGFTVVAHLKENTDVSTLFARYFRDYQINDTTDVLANVQILDTELDWATVFKTMEELRKENSEVYSYIICMVPIVHVCNLINQQEVGYTQANQAKIVQTLRKIRKKPELVPASTVLEDLQHHEQKYHITNLQNLPWSVFFNR